jgi:uncharacterized repeat protein (TIGR01451 family)
VGDLATTEHVTITILAFVTKDGGTIDNEACVDPDEIIDERNELNNCKHALGQVTPLKPDLQITKSADSSVANHGQELTYTVSVSNVGNTETTDAITMTDILPTDVTLVSPGGVTAPAGWTCSGTTTITCDKDTNGMTQGENAKFTIRVTVDNTAAGTIKNDASVTQVTNESTTANNSTSLTTSIGGSGLDFTIASITDNPDPANRPSQVTYTIIGQNNGPADATGVVITIDLPDSGTSSEVAAGTNGFNCGAPVAGNIDCTGDLPGGGGNTIITVVLTVDANAPNDLKLKATIDPSNAFGESDESNNDDVELTSVTGDVCTSSPCFDLAVADIDASAQSIDSGDDVTFTVSIVNIGDSPISPTDIWDVHFDWFGTTGSMAVTPPAGISCTTFTALHKHCSSTALTDAMDLGPGDGITFTVTVTTSSPGTGTLEVIADIINDIPGEFDEYPADPPSNNLATEVIDVN